MQPLQARVDQGAMAIKGYLRILQNSNIAGASPSDYSTSYPRHSLGESYPSAEMQLVYSAAPEGWVWFELTDSDSYKV